MRLLVAEDERELSDALCVILRHNNYSVDMVYNGQDALDYLQADNYDGVVLDIMMPKLDGLTVLRRIREQGNPIPVLLLTAKAEIDDRVTGLDSGADDYLTKPFSTKELLARIRAMLRRQPDVTGTVLHFGDISLNRSTFVLTSKKGSFSLANKEFQMLEMLMASPGQYVSAERFIERIWGYDTEVEPNTVWVYVSYLRRKLTALSDTVKIKVSRNIGYALEECK
ncbi:MAG: response regulator transcription factor [Eubacteriales bacterium]|nr:response regulator transcription factor [Eubacteriales bacterium]